MRGKEPTPPDTRSPAGDPPSPAPIRLLEAIADGVYAVDSVGHCTYLNPAALRLLGYTRPELLGRDIASLIRVQPADPLSPLLARCPPGASCEEGRPCRVGEGKLRRKDGSLFEAEYTMSPLCQGGEVVGAVVVFRDISKLRALVRELNLLATQDVDLALTGDGDFRLTTHVHDRLPAGRDEITRRALEEGLATVDAGADHFLIRPAPSDSKPNPAEADPWTLNTASARLIGPPGKAMALTSREFELLRCLMESPQVVVAKSQLLAKLYPGESGWEDFQRVTTLLSRLRVKVEGELGQTLPVRTVFGRGLVFAAPARIISSMS